MYKHLQNEGLVEELANYTPNFILNQVLNKIIESAGKGAGETISMAKAVVDYKSGKDELKKEIEIGKAHEIADNLSMEFAISKNGTYPGMDETVEVNLHPTTTTLEILERWEEVYEINPKIPYPREETALLDWYEINEYWIKHSNRIKPGLSDYISGGTLEDGQSVEDVAKNKY